MNYELRVSGRVAAALVLLLAPSVAASQQTDTAQAPLPPAFEWDPNDPRIDLAAGWMDAEEAIENLELVASLPQPEGFVNPATPDDNRYVNSDLAFGGDYLFQGGYQGFQVYDIADPTDPQLVVGVLCPGGQGDVSVYKNLLFVSAQETRARIDCGLEGVADSISAERIQGVRIFDISDIRAPRQVAAVQACRGSHTHTLVTDPSDSENVYVYIQGTSPVRNPRELPGCVSDADDPNTALFRIEVVRVPLAAPERAEIVSMPRVFADAATGHVHGLWAGGDHGPGTQTTSATSRCHDITAFPEIGLAAGACSGNGILLDITDPVNPTRIGEVSDPNFAFWHSATFNNDGSRLIFTDEWGGGSAPRCRQSDPLTWGADAIFTYEGGVMELAGYYKLPVPQKEVENCVAHNGSLIPVPGRDLMVQGWYQGGLSVFDFTDPANPVEIAFFDRGPISSEALYLGGYWSTYWYNGYIYGAEIKRGIDVFELVPSAYLSEAEIEAAKLAQTGELNVQHQTRAVWPDAPPVARAYVDQMVRGGRILSARADELYALLDRAEAGSASASELTRAAARLEADAAAVRAGTLGGDAMRLEKTAAVLRGIAR